MSSTVALVPGVNEIHVNAADWFDVDAVSGDFLPGNLRGTTVTIVQDSRPPTFSRAPGSDEPLTRADGAVIRGTIEDTVAPGVPWSPAQITLTVAGVRSEVHEDGTFVATVPLTERNNTIEVLAIDPAGNDAMAWANVTRDTAAPSLTLDAVPQRVTEGRVIVSGRAERGSIVTVNGAVVPLIGDQFSRNVTLSGGSNIIVVRAEDGAGNALERRIAVSYVLPPATPTGPIASIVGGAVVAFGRFHERRSSSKCQACPQDEQTAHNRTA